MQRWPRQRLSRVRLQQPDLAQRSLAASERQWTSFVLRYSRVRACLRETRSTWRASEGRPREFRPGPAEPSERVPVRPPPPAPPPPPPPPRRTPVSSCS